MKHLLSAGDLSRDEAVRILDTAEELLGVAQRPIKKLPTLRGRTVVNLFFEDSTRTRISFEAAAKRLSADVINFSAKGSSASKGEGLKDTALTLQAMGADAVVVRHGASGAPHRLAHEAWTKGAVVNAGDGTHEHPTQALLDAFTMRRHLVGGGAGARAADGAGADTGADLAGKRITIVGDVLHSRVARSNALLLHTLGAHVTLVAPPTLLPVGVHTWPVSTSYDLDATLEGTDALMMLRGPGGADERRLLPERPRVQPPLRPRPRAHEPAARPRGGHAPRPDEPRHGDQCRRRRLRPLRDRRAGHERRRGADGRALPAPRWRARRRLERRNRMTAYLLRNARPLGGDPTDLLLRDGVIVEIGAGLEVDQDVTVVDADGLVALPGLVDLHTHLREPGREDAETVLTGTQSAARGGFTCVHAMANTSPVADTAGVVEQVWRLGREGGFCDVQPVGAVTVGLKGERLAELGAMADSAAGVRVFSDDGICVSDAVLMRRALEYVKAFDGVVAQHAQEPRLTEGAQMNEGALSGELGLVGWPAVAEEAIIARDVLLAEHVGSRLHVCHLSTRGSVEIVRWAKSRGIDVTAEVTPHHLLLTDELVRSYDPIYKVNPPLRTADDVAAVREGLADGTIDIVATDHAPHPMEDKECEFAAAAFGMIGLETALSIVQQTMVDTGALTWEQVAEAMSARPARIGRVAEHGRPLAVGEPAHVVLYDPSATRVVTPGDTASLSRNTPYAGHELPGRVVATFLRGVPTVLSGELTEGVHP
ncbi:aspartate carbamoyltransferase [Aeromicrobium sp. SORGH_AS981]|nr:aspartate carbamoyltransferase [Aeromicrobium sp. SORGH_AS_0981]